MAELSDLDILGMASKPVERRRDDPLPESAGDGLGVETDGSDLFPAQVVTEDPIAGPDSIPVSTPGPELVPKLTWVGEVCDAVVWGVSDDLKGKLELKAANGGEAGWFCAISIVNFGKDKDADGDVVEFSWGVFREWTLKGVTHATAKARVEAEAETIFGEFFHLMESRGACPEP